MAYLAERKPLKLGDFAKMRAAGEKALNDQLLRDLKKASPGLIG